MVDFRSEPFKNLFGFVLKKIDQDVVFIFEIQVDGTISHAGFPGDLGNSWLIKPLSRKHLHRRFQDKMIFVIFIFFIDFSLPA